MSIQKIRGRVNELRAMQATPHNIALGFSIGTFIAILPTFGTGIFFGLLVALLYKKLNKLALFIAFAIWNPFVLIPLSALAFQIGNFIFQGVPVVEYEVSIFYEFFSITRRLLVGSLILATIISGSAYIILYRVVQVYKKVQET